MWMADDDEFNHIVENSQRVLIFKENFVASITGYKIS